MVSVGKCSQGTQKVERQGGELGMMRLRTED